MALVAGAMFASCGGGVEVIANANDASLGKVNGGGKYEAGAQVELTAVPNADAAFVEWSDGVKDNPRTIIVPAVGPVTYTANFVAKGTTVSMNGALNTNWKATTTMGGDYSSYGLVQFGAFKNYDSASEPYAQGFIPSTAITTNFDGQNYNYMFYYENEDDVTVDGEDTYPNWQPKRGEFTETITAIDLTANTVSGNVHGTLFHLPEYDATNEMSVTATIDVVMASAVWENAGKCKPMGKLYTK